MTRTRAMPLLGFFVVLVVLGWAGLQPFDFWHPNRVAWIGAEPGLRFTEGRALSEDEVAWDTSAGTARFELELELRAGTAPANATDHHKLFVLFDEIDVPALALYQIGADLVLADRVTNPDGERWYNDFRVPAVFRPGERLHLRVTTVEGAPQLFLDGHLAETSSGYRIPLGRPGEALDGRILVGADARGHAPWRGDVLSLVLREGDTVLADYPLVEGDEGAGGFARNAVGGHLGLALPPYLRSLRRPLARSSSSALDVTRNLLGFVPLGFLAALLLRRRPRALLLATALGFALSLGIELAQTLMIQRVSSVVDLVLNTLGALLGAWLAQRSRPWSRGGAPATLQPHRRKEA